MECLGVTGETETGSYGVTMVTMVSRVTGVTGFPELLSY